MNKSVAIIVPSLKPTSPVKGAIALANFIINHKDVYIISLESNYISDELDLDKRINVFFPCAESNKYSLKNIFSFMSFIKKLYNHNNLKYIISYCLLPDLYNTLIRLDIVRIASIRANNITSYKFQYGYKGILLALIHYFALNFLDKIIVMHKNMYQQLSNFVINKQKLIIIPNFISPFKGNIKENYLSKDPFNIIFIGWLDSRKDPLYLLSTISKLIKKDLRINFYYYGDGILKSQIKNQIKKLNLENRVFIKGYVKDLKDILLKSHLLVLPSWAEGVPRAALEALDLGLPCLLRDIDGNSDLIKNKKNGGVFKTKRDLESLIRFFYFKYSYGNRLSLLPEKYQTKNVFKEYKNILEID